MDEAVACAAPRGVGAIVVGSFPLSLGQWLDAHSHPQHVPYPVDDRLRAVADALLADPADPRRLDAHARAVGVRRRTLTGLFVHDTGMNFDRWRTHVRLRAALSLLAEGQPVSRVAHTVGYATASAFLAAFRRTVGTSPSRYLSGEAPFGASDLSHGDSERTVAKERPTAARLR